jgi:3-(3-hydroxy-phenyl)propionate hydroxylase
MARADVPEGVATIRIGGRMALSIAAGLAAQRYDAEPGTPICCARRLCRGAVPASDRAGLDAALARAAGIN